MNTTSLLNIAAAVAALTVLALAFIWVPTPLWSALTLITALAFAASVGFVFYVPAVLRRREQGSNAQQLAAIGPIGTLSLLLLLAMGASFLLALLGLQSLALTMLVLGIAAFFICSLVLTAAFRIITENTHSPAKRSHHGQWQTQVALLLAQTTEPSCAEQLRALGEKLRYMASDVQGGCPQDADIEQTFSLMSSTLQTNPAADLSSTLQKLNSLLMQRDSYLRAARSQA
jgi:hypothetical protein